MNTEKQLAQREAGEKLQRMSELPLVVPPVDIYENDEHILVLADFPGVSPTDVDVRLEAGQLDIEGKQAPAKEQAESLPPVMFARAFRVPETVDPAGVTAELKNGVLRIELRKSEAAKPRKISVKAG